MRAPLLRLGTRGSPLALTQAREVAARLGAAHPELAEPGAIDIVPIATTGDRVQDRRLSDIGNKGLFIKELEEALADGRIDAAAHSMKDVESVRPGALHIAAMLPRADVRDRLIGASAIGSLTQGARVGTSSESPRAHPSTGRRPSGTRARRA